MINQFKLFVRVGVLKLLAILSINKFHLIFDWVVPGGVSNLFQALG